MANGSASRGQTGWQLLQLGMRATGPALINLERAAERLRLSVDAEVIPPPSSGLVHEAGPSAVRAAMLTSCLRSGDVAVLAVGPCYLGRYHGPDGLVNALLEHLVLSSGVVVGAMAHAHFLGALCQRAPGLRAYIGPPVAEVVGASSPLGAAKTAALQLVELVTSGPPSGSVTPQWAHTGAVFREVSQGQAVIPTQQLVHYEALVEGVAEGPVLAFHLASSHLLCRPEFHRLFDGAIVFMEVSGTRWIEVDDMLWRLAGLGLLRRVSALILSAPWDMVSVGPTLDVRSVVRRAMGTLRVPTAVSGFVGTGYPNVLLEIGKHALVRVEDKGVSLQWLP